MTFHIDNRGGCNNPLFGKYVREKCSGELRLIYFDLFLVFQGQLKYKEHVIDGFHKMPKALMELFTGTGHGKVIVKA